MMRAYIAKQGIKFDHITQGCSYYSPIRDRVVLLTREQFEYAIEYYSTAFHELVHSNGHPTRLNRYKMDGQMAFGGEEYSREELVA